VAAAAVAAGVALLAGGGELLVRGAVGLARRWGVAPAVIGLTVVAFGTSVPELSVSLLAALGGQPDIAVGNVVGSNIFNTAVIIGICALFTPIAVHMSAVRLEWPVAFVAAAFALLLARDGMFDRLEGGFLLTGLVAFSAYMLRIARTDVTREDSDEMQTALDGLAPNVAAARVAVDAGRILGGLIALTIGARFLLGGGSTLAALAGVSERVVGLTVAAAGTSLPELATSLVAARRGQADVALANVLGSNIFNIVGILGTVTLVTPQTVHPSIASNDLWWMVGSVVVLLPIMMTGRRIGRGEGVLLLGLYAIYLVTLR
jgi:cation:H+ antiporter